MYFIIIKTIKVIIYILVLTFTSYARSGPLSIMMAHLSNTDEPRFHHVTRDTGEVDT